MHFITQGLNALVSIFVLCMFVFSAIAVPVDSAYFGSGTQAFPVLIDGIKCGGTETNVGLCHTGFWGVNDCDHNEDAGLLCIGICYNSYIPLKT